MNDAAEVISSERVFEGTVFEVHRERVKLPHGPTTTVDVIRHSASAVILPVPEPGHVILVRQYRHGLGRVGIELPAGVVDPGDPSPEAAARRELVEETGYGGGAWGPLCVASANPGTHSNLTYSFLAVGVEQVAPPAPEATEDIQVFTASVDEVARLVETGQVVQALHLAPLLKYLLTRRPDNQ